MDVDHLENAREIFEGWQQRLDFQKEGILLVYLSPSRGLKAVFKARLEWGNLIDNQLRMAELLGVKVDESCKDASRRSFLTTEEDILFINKEELFTYENKTFSEKYDAEWLVVVVLLRLLLWPVRKLNQGLRLSGQWMIRQYK